MNLKSLVALTLVAVLLGGLYYWDTQRVTEQQETEARARRLIDLPLDGVAQIALERDGQRLVFAQRERPWPTGTRWSLVEPVCWPVDAENFDRLHKALTGARILRRVPAAEHDALAGYGLDPPRAIARVTSTTGETYAVLIGEKATTQDMAFVRRKGSDEVLVVHKYAITPTEEPPEAFRHKILLGYPYDAEQRIVLRGADGATWRIERGDYYWYVTDPQGVRRVADLQGITPVRTGLRATDVLGFVDEPAVELSSYGFVEPGTTATVWLKDASYTLRLGGPVPQEKHQLYARLAGTGPVLRVGDGLQTNLFGQGEGLFDDRLAAVESQGERELRVYDAVRDATVILRKEEWAWQLVAPATRELEYEQAARPFVLLNRTHAVRFVREPDAALPGPGARWAELTILPQRTGKPVQQVTIYRNGPQPGTVYVRRWPGNPPVVYATAEVETLLQAIHDLAREPETDNAADG